MASAGQAMTPDFAVKLRDMMVGRIEQEYKTTNKVIGGVPADKKDYKPHENSRSAWQLAVHVGNSDVWFLNSIADLAFVWTGEEKEPANTPAGIVEWRNREVPKALARVRAMTPEQLLTPVDFFGVMKSPAVFYLQFAQDHAVHHRGQLSVYLRPMGAKVPDIYGGSFDEPFKG